MSRENKKHAAMERRVWGKGALSLLGSEGVERREGKKRMLLKKSGGETRI